MLLKAQQNERNSHSPSESQKQADVKIRVEFAVEINEQSDLTRIDEIVSKKGVQIIASDYETKTVQFELDSNRVADEIASVQDLQRLLEKETGFLAVLKGLGEFRAAVAELRPLLASSDSNLPSCSDQVAGVVRLSQLLDLRCFIDGEIDGIKSKAGSQYSVAIHEYGDMTSPESIGNPVINIEDKIDINPNGRWSIRKVVPNCEVSSMIGRSLAVSETAQGQRKVLSAAVIARASPIGSNKKQICSCSGNTLWDERLTMKKGDPNS